MNRNTQFALMTGLCLAVIVVVAIFYLSRFQVGQELLQVSMIVLGMLSVAAVMAILRAMDAGIKTPLISITFNEASASARIRTVEAEVIDAEYTEYKDFYSESDFSPAALAGRDNNFALAKLRMDLEQQILDVARRSELSEPYMPFTASKIFNLLVEKEVLPVELESVWREVMSACNKAIHGGSVDDETTNSIVRVGIKLIITIRQAANKAEQSNA